MQLRERHVSSYALTVLAVLGGCGRLGYEDLRGHVVDATSDDASAIRDAMVDDGASDGGPVTTGCDWSSGPPTFGSVEHLANVNGASADFDPALSLDGRTLFFTSRRGGGEDVFRSTRLEPTDPFAMPIAYDEVNSTGEDTRLMLRSDGREAFLASGRSGTVGGSDIFHATRADTGAAFSAFTSIALVNDAGDDYDPFIAATGLTLYFSPVDRADSTGGQDIYVATRGSFEGPFSGGMVLARINSTSDDYDPSETADGRVLVFGSGRSGASRVYYATRAATDDDFGDPAILPSLMDGPQAIDPFIASDGCAIYFAATRTDTLGQQDIYRIVVTP